MNLYLVKIDEASALVMVSTNHAEGSQEAAIHAGVQPAKLLGEAASDVPAGLVIRGTAT